MTLAKRPTPLRPRPAPLRPRRAPAPRASRLAPLFLLLLTVGASPGESRELPAAAQEPPSGTVIVSNMDGRTIWLIDLPGGTRRAVVSTHADPHEVAVSGDGRLAAVTNYGAGGPGNRVQILDVANGTVVREIDVEGYERLHGAAFLPGDSLLALTSERTSEILVVSAGDGAVRRTMPTGGGAPHMLALAGDWIWTANITGGSVARMARSGAGDTDTWPAGTRTEGIAATEDGAQGWTGSMDTGVVVGVDGATGAVVARVEGVGVPYRLAVTADGGTVVVSDPEGQRLVLIDRARGAVSSEVDIAAAAAAEGLGSEPSPQGFTLTPDGVWALVAAKDVDRVAVVHLPTRRVVRFLEAGDGPDGIAFSPVRGGT